MPTVLHICYAGDVGEWSDPAESHPILDYRIIRTGEDPINDVCQPTIALTTLGLYKLPATLNANIRDAVEAHAAANHGVTSFDHVCFSGGHITL